jgi:two-component system C4-dicarboxylate transport sensor histidine kinase DctB
MGEGTGLGLSIAHEIARELGGTIRAGNDPRGGACFTVELSSPAGAGA